MTLAEYKNRLVNKFGRTADCQSMAYQKGYEDGAIASQNHTLIKDFPIGLILKKTSSYAWGYYDGFVDN